MNVFIREMKANRKSLFIWCIGMIAMVAASMAKYAGFSSSSASMNDLVSQMPKAVQVMFNVNYFDLSKASGYYGAIFIYLVLMTTIHAAIMGATIISKEERDKTVEFLFVKPLSRNVILTAKLAAAFVNIVIVNIVTLFSSIGFVTPYSKGEAVTDDIIKLMAGMFILQLLFLCIGAGVAVWSQHPKNAASLTTGILLLTFVLSRAIEINDKLTFLQYISPFQYFQAKDVMYGGHFQPIFVTLSVIIIGFLSVMMYLFYKKRDLHV